MTPRRCPSCGAHLTDAACASCGGLWLDARADAPLRRLIGKGPLAPLVCAACGGGMKSLDVPGHQHEGDLFWGHESPRAASSCVAQGCARCGGVFASASELERAGGRAAFEAQLAALARGAS